MAKRKPSMSADEIDRHRRLAAEAQRAMADRAIAAANAEARRALAAEGMPLAREEVGARLRWLASYRARYQAKVGRTLQTSAPDYRPTARQIQGRALPGIDVEVEF